MNGWCSSERNVVYIMLTNSATGSIAHTDDLKHFAIQDFTINTSIVLLIATNFASMATLWTLIVAEILLLPMTMNGIV